MKQKVTPEFALACLKDYLEPSPNGRKNSAYKVAVETHLTPSTISNYMNGRSKPSGRSLDVLSYYFRLEEYAQYLEDAKNYDESTGEIEGVYASYVDWIEGRGVRPLLETVDPQTGILKRFIPQDVVLIKEDKGNNLDGKSQEELMEMAAHEIEKDKEMAALLESMNRELEALHALVVAQRDRIEKQDRFIASLQTSLNKR